MGSTLLDWSMTYTGGHPGEGTEWIKVLEISTLFWNVLGVYLKFRTPAWSRECRRHFPDSSS